MGNTSSIKSAFAIAFKILRSPREEIKALYGVSLYRNASYLMLNNILLAATGFLFWIVAARLYSIESVGLASAAIAAASLLALISTLGLDFALIRFLPNAGEKRQQIINTSFTISGLTAVSLALIFIVGLGFWSPALLPLREHILYVAFFVISVVASVFMLFIRHIFVAQRKAKFTLVQGVFYGLLRFVPLVILARFLEAFGIFISWGATLSLAVVVGTLFLIPRVEPNYHPSLAVGREVISGMLHFSLINYLANLFWGMPNFVLPLMVINLLGAEENAYFYIAWSAANVLFMIPIAVSIALFAEGSHSQEKLKHQVLRSLKLVMLILVPILFLILLLGDKLLLLFGEAYSTNATHLLWILAFSALPMSINHIFFSVKRVRMQMLSVVWFNVFITVTTLGLSYILLPAMGIVGVGIAWLFGHGVIALTVIIRAKSGRL